MISLIMIVRRATVLAGLVLGILSSLALADSITIPITGTAAQGNAITTGDFNISGPGLSLFQGLPDGPDQIGSCTPGITCNFSFAITVSGLAFCGYCQGYSSGSLGNHVAEFLQPSLQFTGSAIYSGGGSISVPMTVSGTIVGYQLLNCNSLGEDCTLGPQVFSLQVSGTGTGVFLMYPADASLGVVLGVNASFTGTATSVTAVPEPVSLVLTGTGLLGMLVRKKMTMPIKRVRA